jgi:DNA-binding HxlR family transcriptional regulator
MREFNPYCPAERCLMFISGRWKIPIIYHLLGSTMRFSELSRTLKPITQKMLAQQLREMEADGLVTRKVYPEIPPKVEYSLTAKGKTLRPVVASMCKWGKDRSK